MIRTLVDGRTGSVRTTLTITIAWLVGAIMTATYMNDRDATATAGNLRAVSAVVPTHGTDFVHAYDPAAYPSVVSVLRTLHAEQRATVPKRYGCLTLPTTITTGSWGPVTFACPVGVAYKTILHDRSAHRTHVGVTHTFALHPGVMRLGDRVRYELVRSR